MMTGFAEVDRVSRRSLLSADSGRSWNRKQPAGLEPSSQCCLERCSVGCGTSGPKKFRFSATVRAGLFNRHQHLEQSSTLSYLSRATIDPGPSGKDPDIGSGNLAMSDHLSCAAALGPVNVAGPDTPLPSRQTGQLPRRNMVRMRGANYA
jgi:hypothetical protein